MRNRAKYRYASSKRTKRKNVRKSIRDKRRIRRTESLAFNRKRPKKLSKFQALLRKMNNRQWNRWGRAGHPGFTKENVRALKPFLRMDIAMQLEED